MKDNAVLICEHLVRKFPEAADFTAVNDVSLNVYKGEFVALTGRSGSGKSTLMNMIGLIDTPTSGRIVISGCDTQSMTPNQRAELRSRYIGYIFQSFYLEGRYTVAQNVEMALLIADKPKKERKRRVEECLAYVGMAQQADQLTETLSGGEKQRVCIARALANEPELILADEPCGNLDSGNTEKVMQLLTDLKRAGKTVLMVTHSAEDAALADRIITLKDGVIIHETA